MSRVVDWEEFTGRFHAIDSVEIRPRASGYIDAMLFREWQLVRKGDVLFVIDPRPYRTDYDRARAQLAVGDLFPKVTLISSVGYSAAKLTSLGDPNTDAFSYGPSIRWAAFDLGRVRARIDIAEAQADAALATYESAVLTALEETEGALIACGHAQSRRNTLEQAAAASSTRRTWPVNASKAGSPIS